jgi:hypothetical protein
LEKTYRERLRRLSVYMLYWIDGRRSLAEVADLVECEAGMRDVELMVRLAELMVEAGLLEGRQRCTWDRNPSGGVDPGCSS